MRLLTHASVLEKSRPKRHLRGSHGTFSAVRKARMGCMFRARANSRGRNPGSMERAAHSHTVCLTLPMQDTRALKAGKKGPVKKKPKSKGLWSTGGISK